MGRLRWAVVAAVILTLLAVMWSRRGGASEDAAASGRARSSASRGAEPTDARERDRKARAERPAGSRIRKMLDGKEVPQLARGQVDRFLELHGRSAGNLLVAWRLSESPEFLEEAARLFPDHAAVQFELGLRGKDAASRQAALKRLRELDPGNRQNDLLSASQALRDGRPEEGLGDLKEAAAHARYESFDRAFMPGMELAFQSADFTPAEAEVAAAFSMGKPELAPLSALPSALIEQQKALLAKGETEAAAELMTMGLAASRQAYPGNAWSVTDEGVGLAFERQMLKQLDPGTVIGDNGETAGQVLQAAEQRRALLRESAKGFEDYLKRSSDAEISAYFARVREVGQIQANEEFLKKSAE